MNARGSRRAASVAWGLILLAAVAGVGLLAQSAPAEPESARSYEAGGRVAAHDLLAELGFDTRMWEGLPASLPAEPSVLFVPSAPQRTRSSEVGELSGRDPAHYQRFIAGGGTLVIEYSGAAVSFVRRSLEFSAARDLVRERDTGGRFNVTVEGASDAPARLSVLWPNRWLFDAPAPELGARTLVATEDGRALALQLSSGRGSLVLLSSDDWIENSAIGKADNALLWVRLIESLGRDLPVYFDEYVIGGWDPPSPAALLVAPRMRALSIGLAFAVCLALWRALGKAEFPRDPEGLGRVSPLARVRGGAGLLVRAERFSSLAALLRRGVFERLARRARVPADGASHEEGPVRSPQPREVDRLLAHLGVGASGAAAWKQAFLGPSPDDAEGLELLGRTLAELERNSRVGCNTGGATTSEGSDWKTAN